MERKWCKRVWELVGGDRRQTAPAPPCSSWPAPITPAPGTAAPEEQYTQAEVAALLGVDDPRMRAIYSAAHIESRRLAEIGDEQRRGGARLSAGVVPSRRSPALAT